MARARFILTCNEIDKVIDGLRSRGALFAFPPLNKQDMTEVIQRITKEEKLKLSSDGLDAILHLSQSDMRKAIMFLQTCHVLYGTITGPQIYQCAGKPSPSDMKECLQILQSKNSVSIATRFQNMIGFLQGHGFALADVIENLVDPVLSMKEGAFLVDELAKIEARLSIGVEERPEICSLIACFTLVSQ